MASHQIRTNGEFATPLKRREWHWRWRWVAARRRAACCHAANCDKHRHDRAAGVSCLYHARSVRLAARPHKHICRNTPHDHRSS